MAGEKKIASFFFKLLKSFGVFERGGGRGGNAELKRKVELCIFLFFLT